MIKLIQKELKEAHKTATEFYEDDHNIAAIEKAALVLVECLREGGKIITCGNGGSHCDAMHFAEELTGRYREHRRPLPALCISDPAHISCVGNDYGYEHIFSRYIQAFGKPGDILVAISTSGQSKNIIQAAQVAQQQQLKVIALTGKDGGKLKSLADVEIRVNYFGYSDRIQEVHIQIIHVLIKMIETLLGVEKQKNTSPTILCT